MVRNILNTGFLGVLSLMIVPVSLKPAHAIEWVCVPPVRIAVDLGYCYGFVEAYFEAVQASNVLEEIDNTDVQSRVRNAHTSCYATDYNSQKTLGGLAFSSYLNLGDDTLLKTTAKDCSAMLEHYSDQVTIESDPN